MVDLGLPPRSAARPAPLTPSTSDSVLAPVRRRHGLNSPAYTTGLVITDYVVAWASLVTGLVVLSTFSRNKVNHIENLWSNVQHGFWFPVGVVLGFAFNGAFRVRRRSATQSTFSELKDYAMSCCVGG